jgi:transcriptional regulator
MPAGRQKGQVQLPGAVVKHLDDAKVVGLREAGLTQRAIAKRLGVSQERVCGILKRYGLGARQADKEP